MTPTEEIPFEEMCHHAMDSLLVNGLTPREWRWGRDVLRSFRGNMPMIVVADATYPATPLPAGALLIWHDLPVFPMRANGVACVARSNYKGKIVWQNKS